MIKVSASKVGDWCSNPDLVILVTEKVALYLLGQFWHWLVKRQDTVTKREGKFNLQV